jgi:hypothetical protein
VQSGWFIRWRQVESDEEVREEGEKKEERKKSRTCAQMHEKCNSKS